jgi:predicted Fe-Mo cluster-binding NifX family protein
MIVCMPTNEDKGLNSMLYGHFGSAPYYIVYNSTNKEYQLIANSNSEHKHGSCQPVDMLSDMKVEAVFASGMGARALTNLESLGITVYRAPEFKRVSDIVDNFDLSKYQCLTMEQSCNQHHCH